MNDDVKSLGYRSRTVGDDRVSITRQKQRGTKTVFETVEVVDVPPAFVDFVSNALALVPQPKAAPLVCGWCEGRPHRTAGPCRRERGSRRYEVAR